MSESEEILTVISQVFYKQSIQSLVKATQTPEPGVVDYELQETSMGVQSFLCHLVIPRLRVCPGHGRNNRPGSRFCRSCITGYGVELQPRVTPTVTGSQGEFAIPDLGTGQLRFDGLLPGILDFFKEPNSDIRTTFPCGSQAYCSQQQ